MAEIIYTKTKCAECEKDLPKFSIAEIITPDFIVCVECNKAVEADWLSFQEMIANEAVEHKI